MFADLKSFEIKEIPVFLFLLLFSVFYSFNNNFAITYWLASSAFFWMYYKSHSWKYVAWITLIFAVSDSLLHFESTDNHKFLICWINLIFVLKLTRNDINLAFLARITIVIIFFSAATWKLQTPEFRNGSFVISSFASYEGVLPEILANSLFTPKKNVIIEKIAELKEGKIDQLKIKINPIFQFMASWISLGVIFLEYLIAFLFAFFPKLIAHFSLIFFVLITYPIVPIFTFGQCLSLLGVFVLEKNEKTKLKILYTFLILLLPIMGFMR
jgi:hypothetical protein